MGPVLTDLWLCLFRHQWNWRIATKHFDGFGDVTGVNSSGKCRRVSGRIQAVAGNSAGSFRMLTLAIDRPNRLQASLGESAGFPGFN
jgi:hypothetical protein